MSPYLMRAVKAMKSSAELWLLLAKAVDEKASDLESGDSWAKTVKDIAAIVIAASLILDCRALPVTHQDLMQFVTALERSVFSG